MDQGRHQVLTGNGTIEEVDGNTQDLLDKMTPAKNKHMNHNSDENIIKNYRSIMAMYTALKKYSSEKHTDMIETLREFGYIVEYSRERDKLYEIIGNGIMMYIQNNLGHDACSYESSCPGTLEEWYYELARLHDGKEFSPDSLHILVSCSFLELDIQDTGTKFAGFIAGNFEPDIAIDMFIMDNLKVENAVATLVYNQMDNLVRETMSRVK